MNKFSTFFRGLLFLFIVVLFSNSSIFAQGLTTAAINGKVTDAKGEALPGANIIAVHQPSGTQYGTTSRVDGRYNLPNVRTGGPYTITVSFVGYQSQVSEGSVLELGQNFRVDFILPEEAVELGDITVFAERDAIFSSQRTGAIQNVTTRQIETVPTINRSFTDFTKLSPLFSGSNSQAAGRNNRYNNIQIDGTQYNDLFGLGSSGTPGGQAGTNPISLDAINQFTIVIAPYDVRFGSFTGGGVNAITRAGNNTWTGSAYFYGRNEKLVGKSPEDRDQTKFEEFKEYQYGFRVGGPIIKDEMFFFLNGEMTIDDRPSENISLTSLGPTNALALAQRMQSILTSKGFKPGSFGSTTIERPSTKLFARFDFNIADAHKLTLRHNFVDASNDILASRNVTNRLAFDSYTYRFNSQTNSTVGILNSRFGNNFANELIVGYTMIRDDRSGKDGVKQPEVEVREPGLTLTAGADRFSSANALDQDIIEVTNNFSMYFGDHVVTVGTHNEFFSFRNLFIRSFFGYYVFDNLDSLESGRARDYQRAFSRTGVKDQAAEFSVAQFGFYAQDEWTINERLKLTFGLRVDIPTFPDNPEANDSIPLYFPGYMTDIAPSGNLHWSPRFGFNYDASGDRSTQIRGGIGIFTGRTPYVWMSNNYGNTGTLYGEVRGGYSNNIPLTVDPNQIPGPGDNGLSARLQSEINLVDPDLLFPQVLRFNLGVDQQLPWNMVGTIDFIYGESINEMMYKKVNLNDAADSVKFDPIDGRLLYGGTNSGNGNFFDVLYLTNTSEGYQYNLSFQLQRNVARGLSFNTGYVFGRAKDLNSVTSSQARSQMRFNPIDGDVNNPRLTTSLYEIEHRIFASVSITHEFFENAPTTISVYYNGQSGQPFSYVYRNDMNNDGFDSNDLIYIPRNSDEILLGSVSGGVYTPASMSDYEELFNFINNDPYLRENKGKIALRNGARNPWRDIVDIRIAQDVPIWKNHRVQLTLDILNVLNLIDNTLGWNESVFSTYQILDYRGREAATNKPVFRLNTGGANDPFSPDNISSRWAMQLGIRYAF